MMMEDIIISKQIREYLHEIGHEFTDFEKATLIWNSIHGMQKKKALLQELLEETEDEILKRQIQQRLEYEARLLWLFSENPDKQYVYVVTGSNGYGVGYFAKSEMALRYVKQKCIEVKSRHFVEKQLIVDGDELPLVKTAIRLNYNIFHDCKEVEYEEYEGVYVSIMDLDEQGNPLGIWSNEMPYDEEIDEYEADRFEKAFVDIPYPDAFEMGTCVRDILTNRIGVIETGREEWESFRQRIQRGLYVDYADMTLTVYFKTQEGNPYHDHINPIFLETLVQEG